MTGQAFSPVIGRPIIEMFWIVEYNNGQALTQFDPWTGLENSFSHVDHKNVIRLHWRPITPDMAKLFPGTRYNPLLKPYVIETRGAKGFVARRTKITLILGGNGKTARPVRKHFVAFYVIGLEGGERWHIFPDGHVEYKPQPEWGESQDILHHG